MSHGDHSHGFAQFASRWTTGPSEPESHTEHQAALDATVFRGSPESPELVLELDAGRLRIRALGSEDR